MSYGDKSQEGVDRVHTAPNDRYDSHSHRHREWKCVKAAEHEADQKEEHQALLLALSGPAKVSEPTCTRVGQKAMEDVRTKERNACAVQAIGLDARPG